MLVVLIRKLEEVVVNRIASGEVFQRPANPLKEMLETSHEVDSEGLKTKDCPDPRKWKRNREGGHGHCSRVSPPGS